MFEEKKKETLKNFCCLRRSHSQSDGHLPLPLAATRLHGAHRCDKHLPPRRPPHTMKRTLQLLVCLSVVLLSGLVLVLSSSSVTSSSGARTAASTTATRPARIVYGIMLHRTDMLDMALVLLQTLYAPEHAFLVHFDADVAPGLVDLFARQLQRDLNLTAAAASQPNGSLSLGSNVVVLHRIRTEWAKWSIVEVQLLLLRRAAQWTAWEWDYWINVSADMYPLASNTHIAQVLGRTAPASFVHSLGVFPKVPQYSYRVELAGARCNHATTVNSAHPCNRLIGTPGGNLVGFGSQWVALHRSFVEYVLNETQSNLAAWSAYFGKYIVPDESFFQTLAVQDSKPPHVHVEPYNLVFLKWNTDKCAHPTDGNHPCALEESELASVDLSPHAERPLLFARKFTRAPCYLGHVSSHCRSIADYVA